MERPKIKIELEPIDIATEIIGVIGLIILIFLPIYFYDRLPDTIPSHFASNGEPNEFSEKSTIWIEPLTGLIVYIGMSWLNKYPHVFNYPQKVTVDNAKRLYINGTKMVRTLTAVTTCVFAAICHTTIQTAMGKQAGLGSWFTPAIIILLMGTTGFFLYKLTK